MNCEMNAADVALAQKFKVSLVTTTVNGSGPPCRILAKKASMVDLGVPEISLLAPESTPDQHILSESAQAEFAKAVEELVTSGRKFYTHLRPNWCVPALLWDKEG